MDNVGVIGNKCVGCEQCAATCPTGAIEMLPNKEGFFYPSVSAEKCIFCGKCLDRCAANVSESQQIYPMETYAGVHNDVQIRTDSSSGGIFLALAKLFLEEYGEYCVWADRVERDKRIYFDTNGCIRRSSKRKSRAARGGETAFPKG